MIWFWTWLAERLGLPALHEEISALRAEIKALSGPELFGLPALRGKILELHAETTPTPNEQPALDPDPDAIAWIKAQRRKARLAGYK
jgi:hypothetical protein